MSAYIQRTGTANTYDAALRNISTRQTKLSDSQANLTAGKKIVRPSDDPANAANAERAQMRISRIAADQRALDSQRNAIATAESALGDVTDALQRFRELVVNAGDGVNSGTERRFIVNELQGLRDNIYTLANTKDTNGLPLFSALGSALTPFVGPQATAPDYTFKGLPGQTASTDVAIPYALDGDSAFMFDPSIDAAYNVQMGDKLTQLGASTVSLTDASQINGSSYTISNMVIGTGTVAGSSKATYTVTETPEGSTTPNAPVTLSGPDYASTDKNIPVTFGGLSLTLTGTPSATDTLSITPSASLFSVLDTAINDIGNAPNAHNASLAVGQALQNIDIGIGHVLAVRGQAGELINRADRMSNNQTVRSEQLETDRSRAEDLDMVKGISDFNLQQTGYQAALQSYAQVQKLSLFNYIS